MTGKKVVEKKFCPHCETDTYGDWSFCISCGTRLLISQEKDSPTTDRAFCSRCGEEFSADTNFCPKCGQGTEDHSVSSETEPTTPKRDTSVVDNPFCPRCGTKFPPNTYTCPSCGKNIEAQL